MSCPDSFHVPQGKLAHRSRRPINTSRRAPPLRQRPERILAMKLSNRFTLLAFGVIGLSALAASPAAAQNASACRSSVGIIGDFAERCLARPEVNLGTAILSSVHAVGDAQTEANTEIK